MNRLKVLVQKHKQEKADMKKTYILVIIHQYGAHGGMRSLVGVLLAVIRMKKEVCV